MRIFSFTVEFNNLFNLTIQNNINYDYLFFSLFGITVGFIGYSWICKSWYINNVYTPRTFNLQDLKIDNNYIEISKFTYQDLVNSIEKLTEERDILRQSLERIKPYWPNDLTKEQIDSMRELNLHPFYDAWRVSCADLSLIEAYIPMPGDVIDVTTAIANSASWCIG